MGGQHHAPAALPPGKTRYPLYRRLGGPQGRSGRVRKISPPTGIRSPDRPVRSESLYRLSYPGPFYLYTDRNFQYFSYTVPQLGSSNRNTSTLIRSSSNASIRLPKPQHYYPYNTLYCHNTTIQVAFPPAPSEIIPSKPFNKYRVIQNNCRGFNNFSYTIHLR